MHHLWSCVYLATGVACGATRHIARYFPLWSHAFARRFLFVVDLRSLGGRHSNLVLQCFLPHRPINHHFCRLPPWQNSTSSPHSSRSCTRRTCIVAHPSLSYTSWVCGYRHQRKFNRSAVDSRNTNREPSRHLDLELSAHYCELFIVVVVRLLRKRPHGFSTELLCHSNFCVHHRESSALAICQP